jgi:hypothetical protein
VTFVLADPFPREVKNAFWAKQTLEHRRAHLKARTDRQRPYFALLGMLGISRKERHTTAAYLPSAPQRRFRGDKRHLARTMATD